MNRLKIKTRITFEDKEIYRGEFSNFKPAKKLLKDLDLKLGGKK